MNIVERTTRRIDEYQQRREPTAFAFAVFKKYGEDDGGRMAAMVAYYGFFSLFPLLLVFVSVLGFVLADHPDTRQTLVDSALGQFPVIGTAIGRSAKLGGLQGSTLSLVLGLLTALWAGLGVAMTSEVAMNTVWGVPRAKWPNFVQSRLRALAALAALGTLSIASTIVSGYASSGAPNLFLAVGAAGAAVAINVALFAVAYRILTVRALAWAQVWAGAACAAVAWTVLQHAGGYYVTHQLHSSSDVYGTFALVITLLVWMSLGAQILLLGAEVNVVREERLWPRSLVQPPLGDADARAYTQIVERARPRPEVEVDVTVSGRASSEC